MINKVILVGNVGKDAESKDIGNGVKVANFSLATSERYKDKSGEYQNKTEWHNISSFGKQAEFAEKYIKKGSQLYIEGKIQTRSWEDKDGNKRFSTDILANQFKFVGSKSDAKEENKEQPKPFTGNDEPEDLPF